MLLNPVELSPRAMCLKWQAHTHLVSCPRRVSVLQLEGVPLRCGPSPRLRELHVHVGPGPGAASNAQLLNESAPCDAVIFNTIVILEPR